MTERISHVQPRDLDGKYGCKPHADGPLLLDELDDIDWSDSGTGVRPDGAFNASGLTADQIIAEAKRASNLAVDWDFYRDGKDRDDIASETALKALEAMNAHQATIKDPRGYISRIAKNEVAAAVRGAERHENVRARKILAQRLDALHQELGREITTAERKAIEADIIANWHDPRHKPTADAFLPRKTEVSLDNEEMPHLDISADRGMLSEPVPHDTKRDEDAETISRREAWGAFAETRGIPTSTPGTLSWRKAKAAREAIAESSVLDVAKAWSRGERTPATEALFAPFGPTSEDEREQIAASLIEFPAYSGDLWESAISNAQARNR